MPNEYEFDAERWCRTGGMYYAKQTRNKIMAEKFRATADEIHCEMRLRPFALRTSNCGWMLPRC